MDRPTHHPSEAESEVPVRLLQSREFHGSNHSNHTSWSLCVHLPPILRIAADPCTHSAAAARPRCPPSRGSRVAVSRSSNAPNSQQIQHTTPQGSREEFDQGLVLLL